MQYTVTQTRQIAVEAENPEEAQKKVLNGEGKTINANLVAQPRPQPQNAQQGVAGSRIAGSRIPEHMTITPTPTTTTVQPVNG